MHAFDENLKDTVKNLFADTVGLYDENGLPVPNFDAINDIHDLYNFIGEIKKILDPKYSGVAIPVMVQPFAPQAAPVWNLLSSGQHPQILQKISEVVVSGLPPAMQDRLIREGIAETIKQPLGTAARLTRLVYELQEALSEAYAFDVFAPDSYNFGLMITYRQKWEPGAYQKA